MKTSSSKIHYFRNTIIVVLISLSFAGFPQVKVEKEIRIHEEEVNQNARAFIDSLMVNGKVRWYLEMGLEKTSVEAKFRHNDYRLSVEFSRGGDLEDVEVEIDTNELPPDIYIIIDGFLRSKFNRYSIQKVQKQYTGNRSAILEYFRSGLLSPGLVANYEIVVSVRTDRTYKLMEVLFTESGEIISIAEVILKEKDHIEY